MRVRLVQRADGSVLWSETYEGDLTVAPLVKAQTDIADKVAMQLGQTYSVIFLADEKSKRVLPPDDWAAYSCILSFHSFRATLNKAMIPDVQQCLERTVARFPDYSTAWAMLSLSRLDMIRSAFPHDPITFRETLNAHSPTRAVPSRLIPRMFGPCRPMSALFWDRQFEQGQIVGDRALALNPNDTELLADYGYRLALSGTWQKGCAMIRKAHQQDLVTTMYYNPGIAMCAYFTGNMTEAVMLARRATSTSHPLPSAGGCGRLWRGGGSGRSRSDPPSAGRNPARFAAERPARNCAATWAARRRRKDPAVAGKGRDTGYRVSRGLGIAR